MDLPAARHASQLVQDIESFLLFCCQFASSVNNGKTDHTQWVMRDVAKMRRNAERWLHASTQKSGRRYSNRNGTRWSTS